MARSSFGRKVLATLLGAAMVVSLSVLIFTWADGGDAGQTAVAAETGGGSSKEVSTTVNSKSYGGASSWDGLTLFNGCSLRMDVGDPSTAAYLRFEYTIKVPKGATLKNNGWTYYADSSKKDTIFASNNLELQIDNGGNFKYYTSNLVITDVLPANYDKTVYVQPFWSYDTADGTSVSSISEEIPVKSSSVKQVAKSIIDDSTASDYERTYAQGIINACSTDQS